MSFEVLPEIKITDLTALKLERLVADVDDEGAGRAHWTSWPSATPASKPRRAGRRKRATASPSTTTA